MYNLRNGHKSDIRKGKGAMFSRNSLFYLVG